MNEQKRNRMVAAITVNVILLLVILVAVLIYQMAYIPYARRTQSRLKSELNDLQSKIEQSESDLEYLKSEQGVLDILFEQGYVFKDKQ